ncbi:non-hydrolyzing UDP-N-acetylglucosamine 2-epimerase [Desulfobacca acetoxidans]
MKTVLLIFGTRPEAIKMAPVVLRLKEAGIFRVKVAVTAQHRQMLDQVLQIFELRPDYDLNIMAPNQDLFDITSRVLLGLKPILKQEKPDLVLVHGDTTTTFAAALAAFYSQTPVGHVEAGLRTRDKHRPYPEELNRHLTGVIADYHFAPTPWARDNLLAEAIPPERIWITGNTVIDALFLVARRVQQEASHWIEYFARKHQVTFDGRSLLLVTGHRRENFGDGFQHICLALRDLAEQNDNLHIVYPVHLNPNVQRPVRQILGACLDTPSTSSANTHRSCISLLPPLDYTPFVYLLSRCHFVLTDSGGIQEEAPALGKPVLVMRDVTERPEGLWAGTVRLVGALRQQITAAANKLLTDPTCYQKMAQAANPYGNGQAAEKIVDILKTI